MRSLLSFVVLLLLLLLTPLVARAQTHLLAGPSEPGFDAALDAHAARYDLQMHAFSTVPVGWGLEAFIHDPAKRAIVESYFASGTTQDFQTATGMHPYSIVASYAEVGDQGMFGGVGASGDCFRYEVLRDEHAPAADVATARARVVRILDGLHWATQVTGVPGVVARGIQRVVSEAGEPPPPDGHPATLPLDMVGMHDDQSGMLPFLIWHDDASKDQLDGYVMALGACYDAIHGDATFDSTLEPRLATDARDIAHKLMTPVAVDATHTLDLVIVGVDGRPNGASDLNAEQLETVFFRTPTNGFNAWMALGMFRIFYAITGDADIGRYYYEELVGRRGYYDVAARTLQIQYVGYSTNYSNVNMAFVAAYGVLRFENDSGLAAQARDILQNELYAPGVDREAKGLQQAFFDFLYAGFRPGGASDADGMHALADGVTTTRAFPDPPYWDVAVTNCDATEIASSACTGTDGTPLPLAGAVGHGMELVAVPPVPFRIRPPSDFEWRSDPHAVNGGGSDLLFSGQDFQAAYWLARLLTTSTDGSASISPNARPALMIPIPVMDAGAPAPDAGLDSAIPPDMGAGGDPGGTTGGGCGCGVVSAPRGGGVIFLGILMVCCRVGRAPRGSRSRHGVSHR